MKTDRAARIREDRIAYLAAMFAIGELGEDEMRELYASLQAGGEAGRTAARVAWQTLSVTVDLRASLSTNFQDELVHRLAHTPDEDGEDEPDPFLGRTLARLGLARPRLAPVGAPPPRRPQTRWWLVLILGLLLGAVSSYAMFRRPPQQTRDQAMVARVRGQATRNGAALVPGQTVVGDPVILASEARLSLRWPQGHRVEVAGPANVVPQGEGLSLSTGRLALTAGDGFTLGLPDGQLRTHGVSRVAVEVIEGRSLIGVAAGRISFGPPGGVVPRTIVAGQAVLDGGKPFTWQSEARWSRRGVLRVLECDPDAEAWTLKGRVQPTASEDGLILHDAQRAGMIRLVPGSVWVLSAAGRTHRYDLEGAPLLARHFTLRSLKDKGAVLQVEGLDEQLKVQFTGPGCAVEAIGDVRLEQVRFYTGPRPPDPVDAGSAQQSDAPAPDGAGE